MLMLYSEWTRVVYLGYVLYWMNGSSVVGFFCFCIGYLAVAN